MGKNRTKRQNQQKTFFSARETKTGVYYREGDGHWKETVLTSIVTSTTGRVMFQFVF